VEHTVRRTTVEARPTAVLTATTTWAEYPQLWGRLLTEVHEHVEFEGRPMGRNVMLYLDDTPRVEVGVELDQPAAVTGPVIHSTLPAGEVATTVHRGSYADLDAAHRAVLAWCTANGHQPTGVRWEVYGHWHDDPEQVETEIFYLLAG
jgi:effector-binding domain-containing protein